MKCLLFLLLVVLAACSANVRRFVPASADLVHMAHLVALSDPIDAFAHREKHYSFISSVDGKQSKSDWEVRKSSNEYYVTPGTHTFNVVYEHAGLSASGRFEIDAKSGVTYYIHHKARAYGVQFWITEDYQDGTRVGRKLPKI
jgi:hypothetical protein